MAIAFDASGTGTVSVSTNTLTFSHTCTGSDLVLLVGVASVDSNAATNDFSSVTYNGVAMTQLYDYLVLSNVRRLGFFYLIAPATGTHNVVVTMAGNVSNNIVASSLSYTGVSQSAFPDANNKTDVTAATTVSTSVTTTVDNAWLAGFAWVNVSTSPTAGTNTTKRTTSTYGNAFMDGYDSNAAQTPAGSHSLAVNDGTSGDMSLLVASMAPFGAGGGGVQHLPFLNLLGVGT